MTGGGPPPIGQGQWGAFVGTVFWFYVLLYTGFGLCFAATEVYERAPMLNRVTGTVKVVLSSSMKGVSFAFARYPGAMEVVAAALLFGLAERRAQGTLTYWHGFDGPREGSWQSTAATSIGSAVFHGFLMNVAFEKIDVRPGFSDSTWERTKRMCTLQAFFSFAYLPVASIVIPGCIGFVYYCLVEGSLHCAFAVVSGAPANFLAAFARHGQNWPTTFAATGLFWPLSHAFNFVLVQRWSPPFRTTWDGIVALLWNTYLASTPSAVGPAAVGPMLSGIAPGSKADWAAGLDCALLSFLGPVGAMGSWGICIHGYVWSTIHRTVAHAWCTCGFLPAVVLWIVFVPLLVLISYPRAALYLALMVPWTILYAAFWILDTLKDTVFFFVYVPDLFPYHHCPFAFLWPPDGSWPLQYLFNGPSTPTGC